MKKVIGLVLIIVGIYLCYLGNTRRHSMAGGIDTASSKVANKVDGEAHVPDSTWYFVGGGVLIVVGAFSLMRPGRP
jgi:uncharacterized membrane protein HdeD (DUF308 family)